MALFLHEERESRREPVILPLTRPSQLSRSLRSGNGGSNDMTDRETAAKLKARIDQWQAYVGTPMTAQPGSEAGERATPSRGAHADSTPEATVHVRNGAPP